jgi:hypothetical protein
MNDGNDELGVVFSVEGSGAEHGAEGGDEEDEVGDGLREGEG